MDHHAEVETVRPHSVIRTRSTMQYANSPATTSDNGGLMDALNAVADSVYTVNAHTVINFPHGRGSTPKRL